MANRTTVAREPSWLEIRASWSNKRNIALARAIHGKLSRGPYDRFDAHRWALRLIDTDPQNGEDAAVVLANYDYMVEGARAKYANAPIERKRYDEVFAIYKQWKDKQAGR